MLIAASSDIHSPKYNIPMASYAVIENGSVSLRRLDYDRVSTAEKIGRMPISEESKRKLKTVILTGGPDWDVREESS